MDVIEVQTYIDPEKFIDILDECIESLQNIREKLRQEIFYDEL